MEIELLQNIISGLPNFFGLVFGLLLMYRRLTQQDRLIEQLIGKWSECENAEEISAESI